MDNLQKSEAVIARILTHLAENGLKTSDLGATEIGLDDELQSFFEYCARWLSSEGIIRVGTVVSGTEPGEVYFLDSVITAYGFQLLSQGVSLGGKEKSLGAAVKEVSSGKSYSSLGDLIGGILGGFTKSISS
ncbi:hypothetical protein [Paracoccus halophilus]|nr:hypothetical protein [Paracoccus halophilus]